MLDVLRHSQQVVISTSWMYLLLSPTIIISLGWHGSYPIAEDGVVADLRAVAVVVILIIWAIDIHGEVECFDISFKIVLFGFLGLLGWFRLLQSCFSSC